MKKVNEETPLWSNEAPAVCRFCAFAKRFFSYLGCFL